MKYLSSLSFLLILFVSQGAVAAVEQEQKCALTPATVTELRGLRIGMTSEQIKTRFQIIETEPRDEFGVAKLRLATGPDEIGPDAVRDISIELISERVVSIRLVYNTPAGAINYRDFTARLTKSLSLPQAWEPVTYGSTVTAMTIECKGFKVVATLVGAKIPVLYLLALEAVPTLNKRQAETERRLRDFFKP